MKTVTKRPAQKNSVIIVFIMTALILAVPLIAMIFTDEVQWDLKDFIVIGGLLLGTGLLFEVISSKVARKYRAIVAIAAVLFVLLVWAELAVSVFGSSFAGN